MCRWSRVSKSGYYSWRDRPQSQTAIRREELAILIKDVFEDSDGTYGYRRIQVLLERRGVRATGPRSAPSCVTWGYRPRNHGQKSEPPCRLRTWMSGRTCSNGTSPQMSPARSCVGISPMSGRGLGLSILRPFWTAALRRSWVMRWPTACVPPWCARPLTWRYAGVRLRRV